MRTLFAGVLLVLGCQSTLRSRAEVAYAEGNFVAAAALYDQILAEKPGDGDAHVERARARNAAFRAIITAAHASRLRGNPEAALGELKRFLELRRDWKIVPPPQLADGLASELTAATAYLADSIGRALHTGPFAAEVVLDRHATTLALAGLADRRAELAAPIRSAGLADCARLTTTTSPATPYWTWLVDRVCAHWDSTRLAVPRLPHQLPAPEVTGSIDAVRDDQSAQLREAVGAAFRASVWYAPSAPGAVRATLTGKLAARLLSHPVWLTASWTEAVPYTDYETSQESYQEPYDETEWYQEQVPYTEYQTRTVPCGSTTCTQSEPVTVYRTESKTRTVTKHRTAYRTVTKPVTRYRDESRSFDYQAIQRDGHYSSEIRARFDGVLGDLAPSIASNFSEAGVDHDVTHAQAEVTPQRANLTTLDAFVAREQARLRDRVLLVLGEHYRKLHCTAAEYTLEESAACAFLDPKAVPQPVHATLRATLGPDEPHLMHALGR